jgi:RNA polymerase sigma-70 factor, ECF subfamily
MTSGIEMPAVTGVRQSAGGAESPPAAIPDVAIMLRVRDDDEAAFEVLYARYNRRLQDFFYGLSRDATVAGDLAQETFLRVWKLRKKYAATGSFPAYLFTFARNIWLEKCRDYRKLRRLGIGQSLDGMEEYLAAGPQWRPDEQGRRHELETLIFAALDTLPEEQRMAFVMRTVDGVSLEDVASAMQCPTNTVRSRRILAINKLRDLLRTVFHHEQAL